MTVVEHLSELRKRLLISVAAFLVTSIVAYFFYDQILDLLRSPLDEGGRIAGYKVVLSICVPS